MPASASPASLRSFSLRSNAGVVRGRCLPYGEGITYWPVVEVLKQLAVLPEDEAAAAATRSLLGETEAVTSAEEIAWAFRKTLEQAAAEGPLVVVFDDIQWGEETFLDLIEHVALLSSGASVLLFCMARPELAERRADWPVRLRLEPLAEDDIEELIAERVPEQLRERIARAAGGNPLFVEEMLAMAGEAEGEVLVPPTLQALLAARLDQLETAERRVLEWGAIEGEIFHRGAVQALAPEETQVTPRLAALVRKQLIRPDRPQLPGEDGFRFRHLLLRDAAYDALPKAARADLHERYASWLEQRGVSLVELDEILGYHLEKACRYRAELGMPDNGMAAAARNRLTYGGNHAARRQDFHAAVSLFERAAALVPPSEVDLALESELSEVLAWTGRTDDALRRADALAERSLAVGDQVWGCAGGFRPASSACTSSRKARPRSCPRSSSRRCPCSRRRATTWLCTSGTPRSLRWLLREGAPTQRSRHTNGPSPTHGSQAIDRRRCWGRSPGVASSARLQCRNCSRGSTRSSHAQDAISSSVPTGPGRSRGSVVSTRHAPSSLKPARSRWSVAGEPCWRTSPLSSPSGSSSWPAIPSRRPSSEQKGAGCTRSWGNINFWSPQPRPWRRRSTRSAGSRRQTPGPAAQPRGRAATCGRSWTGGR